VLERRAVYIGLALALGAVGLGLHWLGSHEYPPTSSATRLPPTACADCPLDGAPEGDAGAAADATATDPVDTIPLRAPPQAVAELGVVTDRDETALADFADRSRVAALVRAEDCGDEAACSAVREVLADERSTTLRLVPIADWASGRSTGPDAGAMDLPAAERARFHTASFVVAVRVAAAASPHAVALRSAFAAAGAIAGAANGWVDDTLLGRLETAKAFRKHAVTEPLDASAFRADRIQVLYEPRSEGVVRLLTAGLERFGAPDVEIANAPLAASARASQWLTAVAGALADGARTGRVALGAAELARAGAIVDAGATEAHLVSVHPEAGDPNDFIARIEPPQGESALATLALLEAVFGPVLDAPPDEATQTAGRERAQRALAAALGHWADTRGGGRIDGKRLLVRLPFPIPGDVGFEAMWVEVTSYAADTVTGTVVDEPIATDVARGDRVTRPRTQVEDVRELP
jgi:hypothetical protein